MTRGQRRAHFLIWAVLAPLLIIVAIWSIAGGQRYPTQAPPSASGESGK